MILARRRGKGMAGRAGPAMPDHVFISHSSKDAAAADRVRAYLEGRGLPCWVAPRDVPPGANWGQAIVDAIGRSRAVVLVFSAHADRSAQVLREVERAVS